MSQSDLSAGEAATYFRRRAIAGGAVAVLSILAAPLLAGRCAQASPLAWLLLSGAALVALALAVHLLLDAALFRLCASYEEEARGLASLDEVLARTGLRAAPGELRGLAPRIAGSRRILWHLRISVAACLILLIALLLEGTDGLLRC
ncbi:hypothetical protein [Sinorhizobium sp. BG8]|uniref:hypothetical protein n=1 Tax=Sinorhizobium sp. BG8 TaxID=2613773 RepID=UPI00193C9D06|nr:hypothetical protein [Sinorhizobium sp. BG8]QRM57410.1 hypothetical protein F3Y30_23225 [Sinorhizobium sp. BG8]